MSIGQDVFSPATIAFSPFNLLPIPDTKKLAVISMNIPKCPLRYLNARWGKP